MRTRPWHTRLGVLFLAGTIASLAHGGGIGISTPPESPDTVLVSPCTAPVRALFFQARVGNPGTFRLRDLEFLWDSLYSGARGYVGFSQADLALLDSLGRSIADMTGVNPFGAPYTDIRLVHDYFNDHNATYDANPFHPYGFFTGSTTDPPPDRAHVDCYIPVVGHARAGGTTPSGFWTVAEDSSTGHWDRPGIPDTVYHCNSVLVTGPPVSDIANPAWTRPDYETSGNFNHEFQHVLDDRGLPWTEMFSSGAEAVAGHLPVATIINDVPYTWPLIAFGGECAGGCELVKCVGQNYQGWRLFTAYLAYNFRGRDTTALLPSGSAVGFADDLLYRWAHVTGGYLATLTGLLSDENCYSCSTATYFHAGGTPLDNYSRLGFLLHNWRVANYVNNSGLDEKQYGYPPQFGFKPAIDVGAWQSVDVCGAQNDIVVIPPEITLSQAQTTVELTRVGARTAGGGAYSYPMTLQMLGSEYWVVRSDASLAAGGQDLVVRVAPEGAHRDTLPGLSGGSLDCYFGGESQRRDARLVASVVGYNEQAVGGQADSLWKHPEWAVLPLAPQSVDVDSAAGSLEFVVPDFGRSNKAAVVVLSLADGPGRYYTNEATQGIQAYTGILPYRITIGLRKAPYDSPNPRAVSTEGASPEDFPTWSPGGGELAVEATIPSQSTTQQIYRKAIAGGVPARVAPSAFAQHSPDWSPRGDWIAFLQDSAGLEKNDLMLANSGTGEVRLLFGYGLRQGSVAFAPNGQKVAFASQARVGIPQGDGVGWQIRVIDVSGANDDALTPLMNIGEPVSLRWSPDGNRIYFTRHDSVFAIPKEGGHPIPIAGWGGNVASLDFRPGSSVVALEEHGQYFSRLICAYPDPETTLVAMPFRRFALRDTTSGDTQTRFYRTGVEFSHPRWSPDGTRIAYSADQSTPGDRDLFVGQVSYNHAPTFSPSLRDTALILPCQPYTFAFDLGATDPDGEPVTYQATYLPPGATLAGNHFSWVNPGPPGSDHYVVFRALDGSGGADSKVIRFSLVPDIARPAAANDVTLETARYTATVMWTATGDDSLVGQACRFDIRYSTSPITESNFASLPDTVAAGLPEPSGSVHCAELHGLLPCKWYYVALKTCDDAGQWSALSNVGSAKTKCSGYTDIFCEGGMFAQGGGGDGWSTENALLDGASLGQLVVDGYQIKAELQQTSGQYVVRLLKTGSGFVALDEVALGIVDHSSTERAFLSRNGMVIGSASPAFHVTEISGQNLTETFGANLPYVGTPGEPLVVRLNESGAPGDALLLETASSGSASNPDSSGILIQVPGKGSDWVTVARHHPRRRFDLFFADSLLSATVRLVFLAEHELRFVGRVAKTGAVTPHQLSLAAAKHSLLGDVGAAVGVSGGTTAILAAGDALTLGFTASPLAAGQVRDWALFVRGTPLSAKGALATRAEHFTEAPPASFALYQNQPNPFAASTTFRFDLPRSETVRLDVFDLGGRRVATVLNAWMPAGRHSLDWNSRDANGSPVLPGAYVYRILAGSFRTQRKLVVLP